MSPKPRSRPKTPPPRRETDARPETALPDPSAEISHLHIYLTGYRGSGKSSVGKMLAKKLKRVCIDLDDEVERLAGRTIHEVFARDGEAAFRDLEENALREASRRPPAVISLGGGAVLRTANRDIIRKTGICVWLQVDAATVLQRLNRDSGTPDRRPALTTLSPRQEIETLLEKREPIYREVADHQVDTIGRGVRAITTRVLRALGSLDQPP